jgi:hypothetical protein
MTDVIILDNSPSAYMYQPENGLPIVSWYGREKVENIRDRQLLRFANLLEVMVREQDIRKVIPTIVINDQVDSKLEASYLVSRLSHSINSITGFDYDPMVCQVICKDKNTAS